MCVITSSMDNTKPFHTLALEVSRQPFGRAHALLLVGPIQRRLDWAGEHTRAERHNIGGAGLLLRRLLHTGTQLLQRARCTYKPQALLYLPDTTT